MGVEMLGEALVLFVAPGSFGQVAQTLGVVLVSAAAAVLLDVLFVEPIAQPQGVAAKIDHLLRKDFGRASVFFQESARTPQRMIDALLMGHVLEAVVGRPPPNRASIIEPKPTVPTISTGRSMQRATMVPALFLFLALATLLPLAALPRQAAPAALGQGIAPVVHPATGAELATPVRVDPPPPLPKSTPCATYTSAQADRGRSTYIENCAECHAATLRGGSDGSPLTGHYFRFRWNNRAAAVLLDTVRETMPPGRENTLSVRTASTLLAYVFRTAGIQPGDRPLDPDVDDLSQSRICVR